MASQAEKPARLFGQLSLDWIVLAVGIALSGVAWTLTNAYIEQEAKTEFETAAQAATATIQERLRGYYDVLHGLQGVFYANEKVSRETFRLYTERLDLPARYPGIRVLSYSVYVPHEFKQDFLDRVRRENRVGAGSLPEFTIKPAGDRADYTVIVYAEPLAGNEAALGLDLAADPVRRQTMERARDTGKVVASGSFILAVDPTQKRPAFTLRIAAYAPGKPVASVDERRGAYMGSIASAFIISDVVRGILPPGLLTDTHLRIHDLGYADALNTTQQPPAGDLVFDSRPVGATSSGTTGFSRTLSIEFGERQWRLQFTAPRGNYVSAARSALPWIALLWGIVITLLLFGLIRTLAVSNARARAMALSITADLRASEAQLAEAQRMTQELIEALPNPVFFKGTDGRYLGVNKAWEAFFGIPRNAFIGKTVHDLYPHNKEVAERLHAMDQVLWDRPGSQVYETSITTPDGERHDAIYYKATFARADGGVAGLIGTIVDITERKELERRFRETFDQAAVGIVHTSLDGKYLQVNQKFCEMLGYSASELVGRAAADFAHPEDREKSREARQPMWEGKLSKYTEERRYLRKDGSVLWTNRTVSLARDADGKPMYFIRVIEDIGERKEIEERYRTTFDNAPVGIMHTAVDGYRILRANSKLCEMLGYTQDELLGMTSTDVVHPDYRYSDRSKYNEPMLSNRLRSFTSERKFIRKDGSSLWVNRTVSLVRDAAGEPLYFIRIIEDISERKQAEQRQAMEHAITRVLAEAESLPEAIPRIIQTICETMGWYCGARWQMDKEAGLLRCRETWGIDTPEIREFVAASKERTVEPVPIGQGLVRRTYAARKPVWITDIARDEAFNRRALAAKADLHGAFGFPLLGGNEALGVMEFFHRDVREPDEMLIQIAQSIGSQIGQFMARRQAEERVRHLAHYDELTGLPNRNMFNQRLNHAFAQAQRHDRPLAILFIDLDRFKNINDTLGHEAGDRVLREVAQRLRGCLRESDTVGRLGGDEFVVLVEEFPQPVHVAAVAQKILGAVAVPFILDAQEFHITASIGISTYPEDRADIPTLLKNADIAMYRAKEQGRNNYQFYSAQMNVHSVERLTLESGLRRALERNELVLHYQPQIDIRSGSITGMEALVRWQQPAKALILPAQFIPLAEETGLIVPIGEWVLKTACTQSKSWQERGLPPLRIAVNLSARQFVYENLLQDVARVLRGTGLDPALLEFEITESMVMHNPEHAANLLNRLKAMGIQLAIDDFGTGYSSLAYLKRFPIDSLKIDGSFIRDLPHDGDDAAITQAIIAMAHSLRLKVIAEGVETEEQLDFLRTHGCDEIQGYYCSAPLPEEELIALLRQPSIFVPTLRRLA